jgi:hypothetical protein
MNNIPRCLPPLHKQVLGLLIGKTQLRLTGLFALRRSGCGFARSFRYAQTFGLNISTPASTRIFAALVANLRFDASQSPYSGWQNVVNCWNVMRNVLKIF